MDERDTNAHSSLTNGSRLIRNVIWNVGGEAGGIAAAIVATPILIRELGIERFGVLALAWTVFGYFGLFDLGLGSALTKVASERLGQRREPEVSGLFWTCLVMLTVLGLLGGIVFGAVSPLLVHRILRIPRALRPETLRAFYLLALALPIVISYSAMNSILSAYQRFDLINLVRSPIRVFSLIGPLLVLPFSNSVAVVVLVLLAGHAISWVALFFFCFQTVPNLWRGREFRREVIPLLAGFGGWVAANSAAILISLSADRLFLASLISIAAVSYYVVPFNILRKLRMIPGFFTSVLYPAFSQTLASDGRRATRLFDRGVKIIFLLVLPPALIGGVFARELLSVWIGTGFAQHSAVILQWLALAALVGAVADIPAILVTAHRPDLNAKLHAILIPSSVALTWWFINIRGAEGAAIALAINAGIDTVGHMVIAHRILPEATGNVGRFAWMLLPACACVAVPALVPGLTERIVLVGLGFAVAAPAVWHLILGGEDRSRIKKYLRLERLPGSA